VQILPPRRSAAHLADRQRACQCSGRLSEGRPGRQSQGDRG
jgi:hypothetical protein